MHSTLLPSAQIEQTLSALRSIRDDDTNLSIWEREIAVDCSSLIASDVEDLRFESDRRASPALFASALDGGGYPKGSSRDWLIKDAAQLLDAFCSIMRIDRAEVRLELVTTDSCRKWHSDYVPARLITTYLGEGTQWLKGQDADRVSEGLDPADIQSLETGHVGIFKGKLATSRPAIHRSPPISGTGARRLLLVINPVDTQ